MKPEKPLTDKELEEWENSRNLDAELLDSVRQMKAGKGHVAMSSEKSARMKSDCETNQEARPVYESFVLEDYVDNPVALARIKAGITQEQLAQRLGVSQAYISQLEHYTRVTNKILERIHNAIRGEG